MSSPQVTVIIPVWNSGRWLPACLARLHQQRFTDFAILLVDNGSTDGAVAAAQVEYPAIEVLRFATNRGFAAAVNAGIRHSQSDFVALLNVDTQVDADWLFHLVKRLVASPPTVGSVASKMLRLQNPALIDDAGDTLSWYGSARKRGHLAPATAYTEPTEVFSACAGAALYRRQFFERVGLFDETYHSYFEDIDLGLRGQLYGYRCLYEPQAQLRHQGHSAGLVGGRYVTLMTRNRLLTLLKNIPARLLLKHLPSLLYGQLYFLLVYKKPLHSLRGYAQFLGCLGHLRRERRRILANRVIPDDRLERLLTSELGEPGLGEIVRRKVRGIGK